MGPLANARRITAMETFIGDAQQKGATIRTGGNRIGNKGNFFEPTVLTDVPMDARVMNEEPFGPLAVISPFRGFDEVVAEANRLPYGLASYAYTRSAKTANAIAAAVEGGMMAINHHGLALPEVPFGGVKDSGYGSEGGSEAIEAYLNTKFVTQAGSVDRGHGQAASSVCKGSCFPGGSGGPGVEGREREAAGLHGFL